MCIILCGGVFSHPVVYILFERVKMKKLYLIKKTLVRECKKNDTEEYIKNFELTLDNNQNGEYICDFNKDFTVYYKPLFESAKNRFSVFSEKFLVQYIFHLQKEIVQYNTDLLKLSEKAFNVKYNTDLTSENRLKHEIAQVISDFGINLNDNSTTQAIDLDMKSSRIAGFADKYFIFELVRILKHTNWTDYKLLMWDSNVSRETFYNPSSTPL